jgi:hypothetical protein
MVIALFFAVALYVQPPPVAMVTTTQDPRVVRANKEAQRRRNEPIPRLVWLFIGVLTVGIYAALDALRLHGWRPRSGLYDRLFRPPRNDLKR